MCRPDPDIKSKKRKSTFREYVEAILTAVLIALIIRSFGIEAFKIPSSSMIPTLLIGDHIFVNKFLYGFRIPLTKYKFLEFRKPERGEVIVFMYPEDESKDFIKRVVGVPGDQIRIRETTLFINDEEISNHNIRIEPNESKGELKVEGSKKFKTLPFFSDWSRFDFFEEELGGNDFVVQYENGLYHRGGTFEVPEGYLFVMGDNRDNSSDSREWGLVPMDNVKGKAMFVWLSLDKKKGGIRFNRIGTWIE